MPGAARLPGLPELPELPELPGWRLRTQLLASFALVSVVSLIAAGAAVVYLMLGYRTQVTVQRLRDTAASAAGVAALMERQGAPPATMAAAAASQLPLPAAHALVLDAGGTVVADEPASDQASSARSLVGQQLTVPPPGEPAREGPLSFGRAPGGPDAGRIAVWRGHLPVAGTDDFIFVAPVGEGASGPAGRREPFDRDGDRDLGRAGQAPRAGALGERGAALPGPAVAAGPARLVVAVPASSLPSAWEELAPGFAVAAAIALLSGAVVAWWLSSSIAGPIRAVTAATQRIARGEPHRAIPEAGVEEVAQLARGFNVMVGEVERSQQTLRDFVANASHELRTPLTAIQGFSQAVVDGVLDAPEPTRDAAALIHRESERMRRLVEDLLLLSRIEARDRPLAQEPVDLAELLDMLEQRTELIARDRALTITLDVPDRLLARGDAGQLEHLFGNLLDNAAKYADEGGKVTVRARQEGAGKVGVSVHNTGSVIPPDDLPHVFDRFYRVDKSRSRAVAGSGLGLAIAHEVVARHGGQIRVASDPVSGTTFTVTLPAWVAPARTAGVTGPPSAQAGRGGALTGQRAIGAGLAAERIRRVFTSR